MCGKPELRLVRSGGRALPRGAYQLLVATNVGRLLLSCSLHLLSCLLTVWQSHLITLSNVRRD
jgi:hypothetical protein